MRMTIQPHLTSAAEARRTFEELVVQLFFELEGEAQANPKFALPTWIAPTFAAAQAAYAVWEQAVNALSAVAAEPTVFR
jgi:hypothetical protein